MSKKTTSQQVAKAQGKRTPAPELLQKLLAENNLDLRVQPQMVQRDDSHWDTVIQLVVDYKK